MKRLVDFFIILGSVGILAAVVGEITIMQGCTHIKEVGQATINCSEKVMADKVGSIIGDIGGILMTDNWRDGIMKIAMQSGAAVAKCAIDAIYAEVVKEINKQANCGWAASCIAGGDPLAEFKRARLAAWYKMNGYEVP